MKLNLSKNSFLIILAGLIITGLAFLVISNYRPPVPQVGVGGGPGESSAPTTPTTTDQNIVELLGGSGLFNVLVLGANEVDLLSTLAGQEEITVFAPPDEVFAQMPSSDLEALANNHDQLKRVLSYHIVKGKLSSNDLKTKDSVETLEGDKIYITNDPAGLMINGAKILKSDIQASNGIIHVIGGVLTPP